MRLNVLNAIPDHDCTTEPQSVLEVGAGTVITSGHRIDFTDRVTLGKNVIIGGRNSSLWTHNRQETAPIEIGDFCYLGSEVRLAPGAKLPDECILGLGSVLTGEIKEPRSLVAGVPAKVVRPLNEKDLARIRRKTRGGHARRLLRALVAFGYACGRERLTPAPYGQARALALGLPRRGAGRVPRRGRRGRRPWRRRRPLPASRWARPRPSVPGSSGPAPST